MIESLISVTVTNLLNFVKERLVIVALCALKVPQIFVSSR